MIGLMRLRKLEWPFAPETTVICRDSEFSNPLLSFHYRLHALEFFPENFNEIVTNGLTLLLALTFCLMF
jgi:hypothetical protein